MLNILRIVKLHGKPKSIVELAVRLRTGRTLRTAFTAIHLIVVDQLLVVSPSGRIVDSLRHDEKDQHDNKHDEITDEESGDVQNAEVGKVVQAEYSQDGGHLTAVVLQFVLEVRIEEQETLKEHMTRADQGGDREDGFDV